MRRFSVGGKGSPCGFAGAKFVASVLVVFCWGCPVNAQYSYLSFQATPRSWVGQGYANYYVSAATNWLILGNGSSTDTRVALGAQNLDPHASNDNSDWSLDLLAPAGSLLVPGFYANVARYPFNDPNQPGMDFWGNGRGNNVLTGYFNVLEAEYSNHELVRFAVDFRQYEEQTTDQWIDGQFRYNSTLPEPSPILFLLVTLAVFALNRWRSTEGDRTLYRGM